MHRQDPPRALHCATQRVVGPGSRRLRGETLPCVERGRRYERGARTRSQGRRSDLAKRGARVLEGQTVVATLRTGTDECLLQWGCFLATLVPLVLCLVCRPESSCAAAALTGPVPQADMQKKAPRWRCTQPFQFDFTACAQVIHKRFTDRSLIHAKKRDPADGAPVTFIAGQLVDISTTSSDIQQLGPERFAFTFVDRARNERFSIAHCKPHRVAYKVTKQKKYVTWPRVWELEGRCLHYQS